ncbi:hypothetical protein G4B88_023563 [Cannabis sativa]|uniref:DUF7589 domain-containing protein n=1 Tax=Cannabis sativa TaxID=3483 RepID=A0A7J6HVZ9_CANSA|nr:hypothetical protein G4B88_023563 [Cannabis sativa]
MNPTLLEFAKLDFNMSLHTAIQALHVFRFQVTDEWWCEPGHGDWCTCLEKYTLSRRYVPQARSIGRLLPTILQVIDLTDDEESDYWAVVSDVFDGKQLDYYTSRPSLNAVTWSSMETSINNKVCLTTNMILLCTQAPTRTQCKKK